MYSDQEESFDSKLSRYRRALDRLTELEIAVSPHSRLRSYEAALQAVIVDQSPAVDVATIYALAHDLREIDEIAEIVTFLPDSLDQATRELLARLHEGTRNPDDESGAAAREAQYELHLGTIIRRAGLAPVHGKPDLLVPYKGQSLAIEAKRPGRPERVDDRLRSAVAQLRALGSHGIIAMSVDQILRPRSNIILVPDLAQLRLASQLLMDEFVRDHREVWRRRLRDAPVDALLLTVRLPGRLTTTGHLVLGTQIHIERLGDNASPLVELAMFVAERYLLDLSPGGV